MPTYVGDTTGKKFYSATVRFTKTNIGSRYTREVQRLWIPPTVDLYTTWSAAYHDAGPGEVVGIYNTSGTSEALSFTQYGTISAFTYYVITTQNPGEGGTVSGGGNFDENTTCTITATPSSGWVVTAIDGTTISNVGTGAKTKKFTVVIDRYDVTATFAKYYVLKFNKNTTDSVSGMPSDILPCLVGKSYQVPYSEPVRSGYKFAGWSTSAARANAGTIDYAPGGGYVRTTDVTAGQNITLYASWKKVYTVTFNANGGSGTMSAQSFTAGVAQNLTTNAFTRAGYTFAGWATSSGGGAAYSDGQSVTIAADTPLYAVWSGVGYAITVAPGTSGTGGGTYSYTTSASSQTKTVAIPTRTGYRITAWSFSGYTGTAPSISGSTLTIPASTYGSFTATPTWTVNTYSVEFNANGGSGTMSSQSFTYGTAQNLTQNAFTRTGYTFAGWATSASGAKVYDDKQSVTNLTATNGATVPLYAKWTANTYTVTLNKQSGSGGTASVTAAYGSAMPTATMPTRTGYTFQGYYDDTSGGTQYYKADGSSARTWNKTAATTLYARWTANTYTVTLNKQSGTGGTSSVTATYGSAMPTATMPTRTGYTFAGYYDATSSGTKYYNADGTSARSWNKAAATTLYARWTANTYTISYDANGGTGTTASQTATYDADVTLRESAFTPPTGMTFNGWASSSSATAPEYSAGETVRNLAVSGTKTLYAVWSNGEYSVIFNPTGGSVGTSSKTVRYNEAYGQLPTPSRSGYAFSRWYTSEVGGTKVTSSTICTTAAAHTIYAHWSANSYTVTFNNQGGTASPSSATVTFGAVPARVSIPNYTGRTFAGYFASAGGMGTQYYTALGYGAAAYDIAGDATLHAYWTAIEYYVRFDANGGSGTMANQTVTYGAGETLDSNAFTKTGYIFAGWNTKSDGSGTAYTNNAQLTQDLTTTGGQIVSLYAQWTANTYTITFVKNGSGATGTMADQTATYDTPLILRANAFEWETAHKGFIGWARTSNTDTPEFTDQATVTNLAASGTVTLYAVWKQKRQITIVSADSSLGTVATDGTWQSGGWFLPGTRIDAIATITDSSTTQFLGWYNPGGESVSSSARYTIEVSDADTTYDARFRYVIHTLTVDTRANGTFTVYVGGSQVTYSGPLSVREGQAVRLIAVGARHYTADGWTVKGVYESGADYSMQVTATEPDNIVCWPRFDENAHYSLTVSKTGEAAAACAITIAEAGGDSYLLSESSLTIRAYTGSQYTVTAQTPSDDANVYFNGWTRDGSTAGTSSTYTFTNNTETNTSITGSFRSAIHLLTMSANADYGLLEAWHGSTKTDEAKFSSLVLEQVAEGETVTVRATTSVLRNFTKWQLPDGMEPVVEEAQFVVARSMDHEIYALAVFASRSSFDFDASKVNGSYGSIDVSYYERYDAAEGEVGRTEVFLPEDTDGEIHGTGNAYAGVSYKAVATVTEALSAAGRQMTYFDGWYAYRSGAAVKQTSETTWPSFSDEAEIEARFAAYPLCEGTLGSYEDEYGVKGSVTWNTTNPLYGPDVEAVEPPNPNPHGPKWIVGTYVSFVATPNTGWQFQWFVITNNGSTSTVDRTSDAVTIDENGVATVSFTLGNQDTFSVYAHFEKTPCPSTITVDGKSAAVQAGTVSCEVQGEEGEVDPASLIYGDTAEFIATPASGYGFSGWYSGGTKISSSATYVVSMTESLNLVAKFSATVTLGKTESSGVTGQCHVKAKTTSAGEWQEVSSIAVEIGADCYVQATPEEAFNAWFDSTDTTYFSPLEIAREDSFEVADNMSIVALFLDEQDYVYIALLNRLADSSETVVGDLGVLSLTGGEEIDEETYYEGIGDVTSWAGELEGAYTFYRFLGAKTSVLNAVENGGRAFNGWSSYYINKDGTESTPTAYPATQQATIRTARHYVFTAIWGTPRPVEIALRYCDGSRGHGGFAMSNATDERVVGDEGITDNIMQGTIVSVLAFVNNGYRFVGWYRDAAAQILLTADPEFSFTASLQTTYYAKFEQDTDAIYEWEGSGDRKTMRWRSKTYVSSRPFDPSTARLDGTGYSVLLTVDMFSAPDAAAPTSGSQHKVVEMRSQDARRLPVGRPERYMQLEVQSNDEIDFVAVSTNAREVSR